MLILHIDSKVVSCKCLIAGISKLVRVVTFTVKKNTRLREPNVITFDFNDFAGKALIHCKQCHTHYSLRIHIFMA